MIKSIVLFCSLMVATQSFCQNNSTPTQDSAATVHYGDRYCRPQYSAGKDSLASFLKRNLRYPDAARENDIEGRVIVRFLVDEKGCVSHIELVRSIGGGCDEEAKRIIKAMHQWVPATYKDIPVPAMETVSIVFKLE